MRGSLIKSGRTGVWYAKIREHGQQKTVRPGAMTKHEAERALRVEIDRRERSLAGGDRKITFQELAELWLDNHKLDSKKPHTVSSCSDELNTHLILFFGRMIVKPIRPEDVARFKHAVKGKVSATTVNYNLRLLRSILDTGIKLGYAFDNAATRLPA